MASRSGPEQYIVLGVVGIVVLATAIIGIRYLQDSRKRPDESAEVAARRSRRPAETGDDSDAGVYDSLGGSVREAMTKRTAPAGSNAPRPEEEPEAAARDEPEVASRADTRRREIEAAAARASREREIASRTSEVPEDDPYNWDEEDDADRSSSARRKKRARDEGADPLAFDDEGGDDDATAADDDPDPSFESDAFAGWGKLGPKVRGTEDVYEFTCYRLSARRKLESEKTFLKVGGDVKVFADKRIPMQTLTEGDKVRILGRVVARDVPGGGRGGGGVGNYGGTDRQIQNARMVFSGESVEVNENYRYPQDKSVKWLKATVNLTKGGLWVDYEGSSHRVTLERTAPIYQRATVPKELIKKASYVHVVGETTAERPDTGRKSDTEKRCIAPKRVILLDGRTIKTSFEMLFGDKAK